MYVYVNQHLPAWWYGIVLAKHTDIHTQKMVDGLVLVVFVGSAHVGRVVGFCDAFAVLSLTLVTCVCVAKGHTVNPRQHPRPVVL